MNCSRLEDRVQVTCTSRQLTMEVSSLKMKTLLKTIDLTSIVANTRASVTKRVMHSTLQGRKWSQRLDSTWGTTILRWRQANFFSTRNHNSSRISTCQIQIRRSGLTSIASGSRNYWTPNREGCRPSITEEERQKRQRWERSRTWIRISLHQSLHPHTAFYQTTVVACPTRNRSSSNSYTIKLHSSV